MTCPSGKAWVDIATNSYTAHSLEECSGRGLCQRDTGRCKCIGQFAGNLSYRKNVLNNICLWNKHKHETKYMNILL